MAGRADARGAAMSWNIGWCPWGDPVSRAQERTEEMYRREYPELFRVTQQEPKDEETDDSERSGNGDREVCAD